MQPISMMRSPSLALRPVVSVSSTTCLVIVWNPLVGQGVRPLVLRVSCVSLHPMPLYLMFRRERVELFPEVDVLDVFLVGGAPVAALPRVDPARDAFLHVLRVGVEAHAARFLQRLERADDRHELHAVVGGRRLAAPELPLLSLVAQHRAPAARAGIAPARAVAVDLHDVIAHGASACGASPARASGAAPAPFARPG